MARLGRKPVRHRPDDLGRRRDGDELNPSRDFGRAIGLDVVRSLAILFVLASHCGDTFASWLGGAAPGWLSNAGFFGVELFFVLSGFLIGRLLIRILEDGPSLRAWRIFMLRRWMRTLPIYWLWIAVLAVIWPPRFWEPDHAAATVAHVVPYATLTQNLGWPMLSGWFGVSWSLSVEEWFYLGFSALLLALAALIGRRAGFWIATALFVAVPAALRWQMPDSASFDEVLSKVVMLRLDAIAFGVGCAWLSMRGWLRRPMAMLALGALLILAIWTGWLDRHLAVSAHVQRTFLFDAGSLGFALCLPAAASLRRLPRLLAAPFAALAAQSYAIYIVHLSVLEMAGYYRVLWGAPFWGAIAGSLALIWALSFASWRWIEQPILARRPAQERYPSPCPLPQGEGEENLPLPLWERAGVRGVVARDRGL